MSSDLRCNDFVRNLNITVITIVITIGTNRTMTPMTPIVIITDTIIDVSSEVLPVATIIMLKTNIRLNISKNN